MMTRRRFAILAMTALALAMLVAENSSAQVAFRYGRVGRYSGVGVSVGAYRPYAYGYRYAPYARGYYYGGYRYAPYWSSGYYTTPYLGSLAYSYPYYSGTYYPPLMSGGSYLTPSIPGVAATGPMSTQAFYPPNASGNLAALVNVVVPPDAQIWFDGESTTQTGSQRSFRSPPLEPGQNYSYEVKATWLDNGKPVEQTRTVRVRAGEQVLVNFLTREDGAGTPPRTDSDK